MDHQWGRRSVLGQLEWRFGTSAVLFESSVLRKDGVEILKIDRCVENDILAVPDDSICSIGVYLHNLVCRGQGVHKIITDKSGFVCSRESNFALTIFNSDVDVAL